MKDEREVLTRQIIFKKLAYESLSSTLCKHQSRNMKKTLKCRIMSNYGYTSITDPNRRPKGDPTFPG